MGEEMKPKRIQRKRIKGWHKPPNTIYVGRGKGEYGKWGNPYQAKDKLTAVIRYISVFLFTAPVPFFEEIRSELKGKNLMCWCKLGDMCHADVLLWIANHEKPTVPCPFCGEEAFVINCTTSQGKMFGRYRACCHGCGNIFGENEKKS